MAFSLLTALLRSLQKGLKLAKRGEEALWAEQPLLFSS